ncbi:poly(U)-specific 3'-to-5' RNA exonuclease [Pseudocyphellaria aurata]|nr:poly(U)-specific 3'-to-5' RNA exonuclease [Pseudocyphellaria aurata]
MALVDYPDSGGSDDDTSPPTETDVATTNRQGTLKRKRDHDELSTLPPLPLSFHDLYASNARTASQDDPRLHAGRQRLTPHVEGNWPTHVYIEWCPSQTESDRLHELVAGVGGDQSTAHSPIHSLLKSDLGASLPLHISLSRPITLLTHQREAFNDALALSISRSNIRPFDICARGLDWVANQENTRWFLVLRIGHTPKNELTRLLQLSNEVVENIGQQPLYEEPHLIPSVSQPRGQDQRASRKLDRSTMLRPKSRKVDSSHTVDLSSRFHISIGWSLTPPPADLDLTMKHETGISDISYKIHINLVKVKIGNGVTAYSLPSKVETSNGILGT